MDGGGRTLRAKARKTYDDDNLDDLVEGSFTWSLKEKLSASKYVDGISFLIPKKATDLTPEYAQSGGMLTPMLVEDKTGLGLVVPSQDLKVADVKSCVGSRRIVDVVDVKSQTGKTMTMKEFCEYYESHCIDDVSKNNGDDDDDVVDKVHHAKLYNVLSLEFSQTRLSSYVEAPTIVRQLDWVNSAWPRYLKQTQFDPTNNLATMRFPKVQKYVLMSVAGCWTDFHIDMGGTSVWYHILHGEKIFFLIPPTASNLKIFEKWTLGGKQGDVFFGDLVPQCQRVRLTPGVTFFLPCCWIHAVYTPKNSLVFGGNYVHSYAIESQLRVIEYEERCRIPPAMRYPLFQPLCWFVLARYHRLFLGEDVLATPSEAEIDPNWVPVNDEKENVADADSDGSNPVTAKRKRKYSDTNGDAKLSSLLFNADDADPLVPFQSVKQEATSRRVSSINTLLRKGLTALSLYLERIPNAKRDLPFRLSSSAAGRLTRNMTDILKTMSVDDAPTNDLLLKAFDCLPPKIVTSLVGSIGGGGQKERGPRKSKGGFVPTMTRTRRQRCRECEPCRRTECGECHFCRDMTKFGGAGRMKQACVSKKCMLQKLPSTVICFGCKKTNTAEFRVMECDICYELYHPKCFSERFQTSTNGDESNSQADNIPTEVEGFVLEDFENLWQCPRCIHLNRVPDRSRSGATRDMSKPERTNVNEAPESKATKLETVDEHNGDRSGENIFDQLNRIEEKTEPIVSG